MLVTVAALLVAEILLLLFVTFGVILNPQFIPYLAAESITSSAAELYPYLDETPPDTNGIYSWLTRTAVTGFTGGESQGEVQFSPSYFSQGDGQVLVLDTQDRVQAILPQQPALIGKPVDIKSYPGLETLLPLAHAGEQNSSKLYVYAPDQRLTIAAPVVGPDNKVRGTLVVSGTLFESEGTDWRGFFSLFGYSLLFFTIAAGLVGTFFGFITARGLTKRLRAVSRAADAWSRGDFSVRIPDRSGDELSQLAGRLNQMSGQLQTLMQTRQELASLEERNRLARDLHDSVKQQVFATAMQVGAAKELTSADPGAALVHLNEAERLARLAQQELNALIRELRPAALENKGLVKAMREHLADWSAQNHIPADLRVQGERPLPLTSEQALYRVMQEALSNIARHSGATTVQLHLSWQEKQITLSIQDNGHGFDVNAPQQGVGLHSMCERLEALGGTLHIHSDSHGTCVEAICPLS